MDINDKVMMFNLLAELVEYYGVEKLTKKLLTIKKELKEYEKNFLKNEIRIKILKAIMEKPQSKTELKNETGFSYQTIHLQINKLEKRGYLSKKKDIFSQGQKTIIYPNKEKILRDLPSLSLSP